MSWIWLIVTFLLGISVGMILMFYMRKPEIGDDYQIVKPKVRGRGNKLEVDQQNIVDKLDKTTTKKKGLIKKIKEKRAAKKAVK